MKGIVIKSTGSWYDVLNDDGFKYKARIRGKFRLHGYKLTNPVAVGDQVEFDIQIEDNEEIGIITSIGERRNYVVRQSPRQKHQLHLLASNIDQAIVVVTIVEPMLKQGFIDRFILMTEPHNIPVLIVFNKVDLYLEAHMNMLDYLRHIYEEIGYTVLAVSATKMRNINTLTNLLIKKTTLIAGQSGVGKSTLLNCIAPSLELKTKTLSSSTGKGQHTTTFAEMYHLPENTFIIDTPGIKTLSYNNLEAMDVTHNFREFFKASKYCKFGNCTHQDEPKCAVKEAVENGSISELRYFNYLQIISEIENQNYWERHKDL